MSSVITRGFRSAIHARECKGAFKTSVRKYASYEPTRPINERHHVRNNDRLTNMLLVRRTARCTSLPDSRLRFRWKEKNSWNSDVSNGRSKNPRTFGLSTFQNFEPSNSQIFPPSTLRALKFPNFQTREVINFQIFECWNLQFRVSSAAFNTVVFAGRDTSLWTRRSSQGKGETRRANSKLWCSEVSMELFFFFVRWSRDSRNCIGALVQLYVSRRL